MMKYPAYIDLGGNRYRERFGLDFEDFSEGQIFKHRPGYTLTQQDNIDDCMDTLNQAMLHYDHHYAAQTEFRRPLMVTTAIIQRLVGMTWKTFNKRKAITGWSHITMKAPVFAGDTLYAQSRIVKVLDESDDPECGALLVCTEGLNDRNEIICETEYRALLYRRAHLPFLANGY